ncbi:Bgt-20523 [Blumeria graminis f. sp. tritici]|uniref:Bgt-20523 n=2 Tax=Blumeria graminis f. sp. tritici TaxID=62690 RepID=A0A381L5K8_BLUGR|nr:Bgt-20523 [Blumeria graminis f. sp. tritici]
MLIELGFDALNPEIQALGARSTWKNSAMTSTNFEEGKTILDETRQLISSSQRRLSNFGISEL